MYGAYSRIFERLGLEFRAVLADTGAIGGSLSHEFHVLADSGEDAIAFSDQSDYAANVEMAEAKAIPLTQDPEVPLSTVETPGQHSIEEVSAFLSIPPEKIVKTLIVKGSAGGVVALLLRGDHALNPVKALSKAAAGVSGELLDGPCALGGGPLSVAASSCVFTPARRRSKSRAALSRLSMTK